MCVDDYDASGASDCHLFIGQLRLRGQVLSQKEEQKRLDLITSSRSQSTIYTYKVATIYT